MPIVDDPHDFGRIAATNANGDVYAMGGVPILALAILGMPLGKLPVTIARDILAGGAAACASAGIPVAGGHSIDTAEPIYGLAVVGTAPPDRIRRYAGARPGDALILTKAIGVRIYAKALRRRCYRLPNWLIVLVVLLLASVVAERAKAAAPPVSAAIVLVQ
jgi:selenide, water dikinase